MSEELVRGPTDFRAAMSTVGHSSDRPIAVWLIACCALILLMVVVGGVTRLTHSGLSMTEWQPLIGAIPPLNPEQWDEVFRKYQLTPEYLKINRGMTLDEFKGIFSWEYFHRLLGRSIGAVFLLPSCTSCLAGRLGGRWPAGSQESSRWERCRGGWAGTW